MVFIAVLAVALLSVISATTTPGTHSCACTGFASSAYQYKRPEDSAPPVDLMPSFTCSPVYDGYAAHLLACTTPTGWFAVLDMTTKSFVVYLKQIGNLNILSCSNSISLPYQTLSNGETCVNGSIPITRTTTASTSTTTTTATTTATTTTAATTAATASTTTASTTAATTTTTTASTSTTTTTTAIPNNTTTVIIPDKDDNFIVPVNLTFYQTDSSGLIKPESFVALLVMIAIGFILKM
ncbi:hypothetical protein DPMN_112115 [Dreissena polymorpha]|uniref:Uncharacterized protein n=1 Tax=Dreissena polymorpha TaxID=45954 RepID=A0A9D4KF21_DREPO|nr:hypothetical protein DPMN_112115 [Dreissena polymorpha]